MRGLIQIPRLVWPPSRKCERSVIVHFETITITLPMNLNGKKNKPLNGGVPGERWLEITGAGDGHLSAIS
jgi:hypothetical protein